METDATRALRLAGDLEPKALRLNRALRRDGGAGWYASQERATLCMRRMRKKMGSLSA